MYGGTAFGRIHWVHHYVEVLTGFTPMNRKNDDGSIDVLGVSTTKISSGLSFGGYNRAAMQKSLAEHARKLEDAGAKIIKHTKNRLVARYKNETGVYVISPLTANTFYEKEWRNEK
jgi:hypothetical protein